MPTHSEHNFLETEKNYGNGGQCVVTIWIDHTAMASLPRSTPYRGYTVQATAEATNSDEFANWIDIQAAQESW